MFKKYYKEANDDIEVNRDLIDKIFEAAEKPQKMRVAKIYKIGVAVAAVVYVAVSAVAVLPILIQNNEVNQVSELAVAENNKDVNIAEKKEDVIKTVETETANSGESSVQPIEAKSDNNPVNPEGGSVLAVNERKRTLSEPEKAESRQMDEDNNISKNEIIKSDNNDVVNNDVVVSMPSAEPRVAEDKPDIVAGNSDMMSENTDSTKWSVREFSPIQNEDADDTEKKIKPVEQKPSNADEETGNDVVLAMETGEAQAFSMPGRGVARAIEEPEKNEEIIENETAVTLEEFVEVNENEQRVIDSMLKSYFGEKDETTGNEYIFEIVGKKDEGYFGRWKWLVEDHSSLLTEFIITSDMTEMYECDFGEDGEISWLSESNLFEN